MDKIIKLHLQGMGRYKISQETGVSERQIRKVIAEYHGKPKPISTKERITFTGNDTIIDKVIHLTADQLKSKEDVMMAVGFDPGEWECISAEVSSWNGMAKIDDEMVVKDLYSVRVKVKPKKNAFDIDAVLAKIANMEPVEILPNPIRGKGLLEVFLSDAHFGLDNNYTALLSDVIERCKAVEEVVIIVGSDGLHVDNVKNTTVNGTQLEAIDLNEAWNEMYEFYFNLIYQCLRMDKKTLVKYIAGNHDATSGWTIIKALERTLPDADYDTSMEVYKAHRFGGVAIGWTHGDRGKRVEFDRLFLKRYPWIFGDAQTIEIHYGHIHHESAKDSYGNMIRSLPTATAQSQWTIDSGYEAAQRFQLFEYGEESLRAIYYV